MPDLSRCSVHLIRCTTVAVLLSLLSTVAVCQDDPKPAEPSPAKNEVAAEKPAESAPKKDEAAAETAPKASEEEDFRFE